MIRRNEYMDMLARVKDQRMIKVVTGVRRCGKSTLLQMSRQELMDQGIPEICCLTVNFEDIRFERLKEYHRLYDYILERLVPQQKNYIFLDEIQAVSQFQKAVDSLFLREDVDIYLTGSNACMLSGELATLLSGRYVEIRMLPFSFGEYYQMTGGNMQAAFRTYMQKGGFPYAAAIGDDWVRKEYLQGIYNTVLLKDVVTRRWVSDVPMLEAVVRFLLDNIGNIVSVKKIADSLTSDGRKTTPVTCDREFAPLKAIPDNFPKQVLTLDEFPMGEDGINQKNVVEFLLEGKS